LRLSTSSRDYHPSTPFRSLSLSRRTVQGVNVNLHNLVLPVAEKFAIFAKFAKFTPTLPAATSSAARTLAAATTTPHQQSPSSYAQG
jgi:hypothetical protein